MIPQHWIDERAALARLAHAQSQEGYEFAPDEKPVQQADIDALAATPVTAEELAAFTDMRGEYQLGDTRAFVMESEQRCKSYNAWMVRDAKGDCQLLSESPADIRSRMEAA